MGVNIKLFSGVTQTLARGVNSLWIFQPPNMVAMVVGTVMYDVLELVVETYAEYFVGTAIDIGAGECW